MIHHNVTICGTGNIPSTNYDFYFEKIIPKFTLQNKTYRQIINIHKIYHLEGFCIKTYDTKLKKVMVYGWHPNVDSKTNELCLSNDLQGQYVLDIENLKNLLISMLEVYNLDECYNTPIANLYETKNVDAQGQPFYFNLMKGIIYNEQSSIRSIY